MYQDCYTGGWWSDRLEGDKLPVSDKASLESIIVQAALSENCRLTGRKEEGTLLKLAEELRSGAGGCAVHEVEDCYMSVRGRKFSRDTRIAACHVGNDRGEGSTYTPQRSPHRPCRSPPAAW